MNYSIDLSYNVWITALTGKYSSQLIERLINKGYSVSALANNNKICFGLDAALSSIIAIKLTHPDSSLKAITVAKEVDECLTNMKAYYFSIVISTLSEMSWITGNIIFEPKDNKTMPVIKPKNKPLHLKVVKNEPPTDSLT